MRKNNAFRRAAALLAALSITVSLAAPAFAGTYYIDYGDITITKMDDGSQKIEQNGKQVGMDAAGVETIITTTAEATTTLESDLEGPAAEDSGFGPVVEDNYQQESTDQPAAPAQPEDADQPEDAEEPEGTDQPESTEEPKAADRKESAEEPKSADQPESAEEPKSADQHESAGQQPQQAAPTAADDRQESAGQPAQPLQAAPAPAPTASTPKNDKGNGFWGNTITVINKFADTVLNLTLKDVKIDVSDTGGDNFEFEDAQRGKAALSVQGKGNVEIELDGKNELKSGVQRAGLEKNTSTSTGTLTLKDDKEAGSGSLKATGGKYGAGIGGGNYGSGENITITGGRVNATGGWGSAGIGGGNYGHGNYGSGKNITIKGGTVTAKGGDCGAGIGGGNGGIGENITITGGRVNAKGGDCGAGIGGGDGGYGGYGNGKNITITDGTVTATGGIHGAGIGGGQEGSGENITITDGTVTATGGIYGAGIGGGQEGSGSNVTVSGAAQVTTTAGKSDGFYGAGATIGNGGNKTPGGELVDGEEIQADIRGVTTGYIHHIIYEQDGTTIKREWWEPERPQPNPESPQPNPEDPNAPAGESNEVSLGTPGLHVETLEGDLLPFDAQQQGSTLRVTSNTLAARLHGTRQALEALQEQGVEQIQFVTSFKTTTLPVAELLAEGGSWFALEHDGLVSRRLSAAQAESLKCWRH